MITENYPSLNVTHGPASVYNACTARGGNRHGLPKGCGIGGGGSFIIGGSMSSGDFGRRLSAQDAAFLYFEKEEAPLHIGSIALLEGDVSYDRFVESIEKKLHLIPRYLQRAVPVPFNLGHPTWEWDPDFDIRKHIFEVQAPAPGTDEQLIPFAADIFAGMLDRDKPLWEMYLVKGLEGDRSAIVSKVHHCLVDGVSGIELLMIVLDVTPNPPPP